MTYTYENLGDERFQQFAQALLSATFPGVQCLPVGQPDGGRDAFILARHNSKRQHIVFQVKYSKSPGHKSERDAVEELIKTEKSKVEKLITKGLTTYYMISNVSGTSHPEVGSIDRMNDLLTTEFGVDSYCWWRDDLDSRLNNLPNIKWSFPDILKGSDILQFVTGNDDRAAAENRKRAVHSYIASQYQNEREVRFKQADIQNKIIDLFVDLPIKNISRPKRKGTSTYAIDVSGVSFQRSARVTAAVNFHKHLRFKVPTCAETILAIRSSMPCQQMVIEGAPGQGKSTITQYTRQVHRIRILSHNADLAVIPKSHAFSLLRIPFRVDLRDYATWVGGRNPYAATDNQTTITSVSLEGFLSAQVAYLSGGLVFSPADFLSVAKSGPICIVLDGFDEVADISIRKRIVTEISQCSERLIAHETNLRIIITSRPAAFVNSPGFSQEEWTHYELQDLTEAETKLYTQKWMSAKSLPSRERSEFHKQVEEKLEQPHMRELARNPMQLTILLSLILTRGFSLPDKRTALYDSYMDTFFNREAEKSRIVRDHRDLLVAIHRFLAWELHTQAESNAGTGSIGEESLKVLLRTYLSSQGHDPSLIEALFTGMIERVVALVSRVQGTYEFEVQPLREYFAARYLYETAPYSPPGVECKGTKPDRFEALERNFYWLNVTRFYAGCYSSGELASLADGLVNLSESAGYRLLTHPAMLTTMLLGDYVFAQQPNTIKRVINSILCMNSILILASVTRSDVALPERCGRSDISTLAYNLLANMHIGEEHRTALLRVVRANTDVTTRTRRWKEERTADTAGWLSTGRKLGVLETLTIEEKADLLSNYPKEYMLEMVTWVNSNLLGKDEEVLRVGVELALDATRVSAYLPFESNSCPAFECFLSVMSPSTYYGLLNGNDEREAKFFFFNVSNPADVLDFPKPEPEDNDLMRKIKAFLLIAAEELEAASSQWRTSLLQWKRIIDAGLKTFGSRWAFHRLAVVAANVKNRSEVGVWTDGAWTRPEQLTDRVRYARLRSGNAKWWATQLDGIRQFAVEEIRLRLFVFFLYAKPIVLSRLSSDIQSTVEALSAEEWERLFEGLSETLQVFDKAETMSEAKIDEQITSLRVLALIGRRFGDGVTFDLCQQNRLPSDSHDRYIQALVAEAALNSAIKNPSVWFFCLKVTRINSTSPVFFSRLESDAFEIPYSVAEEVLKEPDLYAGLIINAAHRAVALTVGMTAQKLAEVAKIERWSASV